MFVFWATAPHDGTNWRTCVDLGFHCRGDAAQCKICECVNLVVGADQSWSENFEKMNLFGSSCTSTVSVVH